VISAREFAQRVADRVERPLEEVLPFLRERHILPSGAPPHPRKLLVTEIAFSGVKSIEGAETPFGFRWHGLGPGLHGIASDANLRGKSTILEVVLWCLRGRPKRLQDAVRAWIRNAALGFEIDGVAHRVEFRLDEDVPIGVLSRGTPGDAAPIEIARFAGEDEFEGVMDDFMMRALELSELKSRPRYSHDTLAQTVGSGWVGYSKALHIAGSQPILLGDEIFGGLPGRLLQMFLGIPYAELMMRARAARGEERETEQQSQRRADLDREADEAEIAELERQLKQAMRDRDTASTVSNLIGEAVAQGEAIAIAIARRTGALEASNELGLAAAEAERAADDEAATFLHMGHAIKAKRYFTGLDPVCCPRCRRPIDSMRKTREVEQGACSVCATPREHEEEATALAALDEANQRASEARSIAEQTRSRHNEALRILGMAENNLSAERRKLEEIERRRAAGDPHQAAEMAVARLQGRIEERRTRPGARVEAHHVDRTFLDGATTTAGQLRRGASEELLQELNTEIRSIAASLGIPNLEEVAVLLNATMRVVIGGQPTNFARLTGGERLRLRIATVVAMLRIGERRGVGRHPGLILIDSPGDEEVVDENLAEMLHELDRLAGELEHLQVFVASARPAQIVCVIPPERRRVATSGGFLW
jgi:hypothetical protein